MRQLAPLLFFSLAACASVDLAAPVRFAKRGPAFEQPIRRVVALPATCADLTAFPAADNRNANSPRNAPLPNSRCPIQGLEAIDEIVRGSLEFQGHEVIDAERVNAETALRREVEVRHSFRTTTIELSRSLFTDATPREQQDILRTLEADGIIETRVYLGATIGVSRRRPVTVQVRLRTAKDNLLAWVRRCELETDALHETVAIERGARCVMEKSK